MCKKKYIKRIALCLTALTAALSYTTDQKKKSPKQQDYAIYKPITLEEVVDLAYLNRQDLESFDFIIRGNWYAERSALGGFLPQFSITADSGRSSISGVSGFGLIPRENISFNVSQLIFSADGPMYQYKIAQEDTNISRAQRGQLQNSIRFNSESSFLELKKTLLKNILIKSINDSSVETFEREENREDVGFLNRTQWENAKAIFSKDQTDVKNYPISIDAATSRLQREINTPIDPANVSLAYKEIDKLELLTIDEYYDLAISNRPDLDEQRYKIKQADYSNKYYKYRYVPEIYLAAQVQKSRMVQCPPIPQPTKASIEYMGQNMDIEIPNTIPFDNTPLTWHVGLQATWNFDGLSSFNTSKKFDNLGTSFILQKRDLELKILKEIQVTYDNLVTLMNLLEPTKKRYETAKTQLANVKTQYDVGLAASYQYKQANVTFKQADFDYKSIKIDIRNNYQRLLFLCGYPQMLN